MAADASAPSGTPETAAKPVRAVAFPGTSAREDYLRKISIPNFGTAFLLLKDFLNLSAQKFYIVFKIPSKISSNSR